MIQFFILLHLFYYVLLQHEIHQESFYINRFALILFFAGAISNTNIYNLTYDYIYYLFLITMIKVRERNDRFAVETIGIGRRFRRNTIAKSASL